MFWSYGCRPCCSVSDECESSPTRLPGVSAVDDDCPLAFETLQAPLVRQVQAFGEVDAGKVMFRSSTTTSSDSDPRSVCVSEEVEIFSYEQTIQLENAECLDATACGSSDFPVNAAEDAFANSACEAEFSAWKLRPGVDYSNESLLMDITNWQLRDFSLRYTAIFGSVGLTYISESQNGRSVLFAELLARTGAAPARLEELHCVDVAPLNSARRFDVATDIFTYHIAVNCKADRPTSEQEYEEDIPETLHPILISCADGSEHASVVMALPSQEDAEDILDEMRSSIHMLS